MLFHIGSVKSALEKVEKKKKKNLHLFTDCFMKISLQSLEQNLDGTSTIFMLYILKKLHVKNYLLRLLLQI